MDTAQKVILVGEIDQALADLRPALRRYRDDTVEAAGMIPDEEVIPSPQLVADVAALSEKLRVLTTAWQQER